MEYKDADGFNLIFADDTEANEKDYFATEYPNVNEIINEKLHCTACDTHIGSAPIMESTVKVHPILKVTVCRTCFTFYNSGEFEKGEDGSELFCRWCGQGGEVYCCCKCPFVFCKKCIQTNLPRSCLTSIEQNDTWACFRCENSELKPLRARHWALTNYMEKQKLDIGEKYFTTDKIAHFMRKDNSICCKSKIVKIKSSSSLSEIEPDKKRRRTANSLSSALTSITAATVTKTRKILMKPKPILPKITPPLKIFDRNVNNANNAFSSNFKTPITPNRKIKSNDDEVVCTPDIFELITQRTSEIDPPKDVCATIPALNVFGSTSQIENTLENTNLLIEAPAPPRTVLPLQPPPPLVVREVQPTNTNGTAKATNKKRQYNKSQTKPIYHVINGYKIDLNNASKHQTFRLPNGKLIQVRKQPTPDNVKYTINDRPPQEIARLANLTQQQQVRQQFLQNQQKRIQSQITPAPRHQTPRPRQVGVGYYHQHNQRQIFPMQTQPSNLNQVQLPTPQLIQSTNNRPMYQIIPNTQTATRQRFQIPSVNPYPQVQPPFQQYFIDQISNQIQSNNRPTVSTRSASGATSFSSSAAQKKTQEPIKRALEQCHNRIKVGTDICDHIKAKFVSLTKSHSYRDSESKAAARDLNLHLTYLITYAIGRFKNLQDRCNDDLKEFCDDKPGSTEDEVEFVENNTTLIEINSDNEEETETNPKTIRSIKTEPQAGKVSCDVACPVPTNTENLHSLEASGSTPESTDKDPDNSTVSIAAVRNREDDVMLIPEEYEVINIDDDDDEPVDSSATKGSKKINEELVDGNVQGEAVDENCHGEAVDEHINGADVDENVHGKDVDGNVHGEDVDENVHGEDVDENIHEEDIDENAHEEDVDENVPGEAVEQNVHGEAFDEHIHGVDEDENVHEEDVSENVHGEDVEENAHREDVDENVHGEDVDENAHGEDGVKNVQGEAVDENVHGEAVDEHIHGADDDENVHGEAVDENVHGKDVDEKAHGEDVDENIHGVDVDENAHGEDVDKNAHVEVVDVNVHEEVVDKNVHEEGLDENLHGDDVEKMVTSEDVEEKLVVEEMIQGEVVAEDEVAALKVCRKENLMEEGTVEYVKESEDSQPAIEKSNSEYGTSEKFHIEGVKTNELADETSAKNIENVNEIIEGLISTIDQKQKGVSDSIILDDDDDEEVKGESNDLLRSIFDSKEQEVSKDKKEILESIEVLSHTSDGDEFVDAEPGIMFEKELDEISYSDTSTQAMQTV